MKTVIVASNNPVKLKAAEEGFKAMFPAESFHFIGEKPVISISVQPMTDAETLQGASERAHKVKDAHPEADYWIGIEGGVEDSANEMGAFAWAVVLDNEGMGKGRTGVFYLPQKVAELVRNGVELGEADDRIFSRNNSKQKNGAVGLLTGDAIDRANYYIPAVIFALIPFKNPDLYR